MSTHLYLSGPPAGPILQLLIPMQVKAMSHSPTTSGYCDLSHWPKSVLGIDARSFHREEPVVVTPSKMTTSFISLRVIIMLKQWNVHRWHALNDFSSQTSSLLLLLKQSINLFVQHGRLVSTWSQPAFHRREALKFSYSRDSSNTLSLECQSSWTS